MLTHHWASRNKLEISLFVKLNHKTHMIRRSMLTIQRLGDKHLSNHWVDAEHLIGWLIRSNPSDAVPDWDVLILVWTNLNHKHKRPQRPSQHAISLVSIGERVDCYSNAYLALHETFSLKCNNLNRGMCFVFPAVSVWAHILLQQHKYTYFEISRLNMLWFCHSCRREHDAFCLR